MSIPKSITMLLTSEQQSIIQTTGNIKINAVAGSGKTTTIIEYARTRSAHSKILYLAFNRSVKLEAEKKFAEIGLKNVKVETAHSLAYKHVVFKYDYTVRNEGYKSHETTEILNIAGSREKHTEFILGNHVNKFVAYFCNSAKTKVQELNYLDVVHDTKAKKFVEAFYPRIEKFARTFLSKMDKGEIEITHDFYLKKFQLSNPVLNYDFILFDEGQDASPAMLDVFMKQKAVKVIVGDAHQQIYGWRYAVNSLDKLDYPVYHLSNSFRFNQNIAKLATEVLELKKYIKSHNRVKINGSGSHSKYESKAVLARTNLGLLLKAIEYVTEKKKVNRIYFEGNINSYTYADEGASLYDVLSLYNGNRKGIRDKLIRSMKDIAELQEYIDKTEDVQLGMLVEIVITYGNRIPGIIKTIKEKHLPNEEKHKAEMIFSTVHRSKGMEYDAILLANDFINEETLLKLKKQQKADINRDKLNEEINLLYVAVTRTKNSIHIPEALLPKDFPKSKNIFVVKQEQEEEKIAVTNFDKEAKKERSTEQREKQKEKLPDGRAYSVEKVREKHSKAYAPWTTVLDDELTKMFCEKKPIRQMIQHFGRTRGAITSRIKKLELKEKYS